MVFSRRDVKGEMTADYLQKQPKNPAVSSEADVEEIRDCEAMPASSLAFCAEKGLFFIDYVVLMLAAHYSHV